MKSETREEEKEGEGRIFDFRRIEMERDGAGGGAREKSRALFGSLLEEMSDRSWLQKATARILSGRWFWVDITCPTGANETPGRQKSRRQAVRKSS